VPYTADRKSPIILSPGRSVRWEEDKPCRELLKNTQSNYSYRGKIEFIIRVSKIRTHWSDIETAKYYYDIGSYHIA